METPQTKPPDKITATLQGIADFIRQTKFGSIRIEVHGGEITTVEKTVKERL